MENITFLALITINIRLWRVADKSSVELEFVVGVAVFVVFIICNVINGKIAEKKPAHLQALLRVRKN